MDPKKDDKKVEVPEVPMFEVGQQGFFDGNVLHAPGDKIYWVAPEGWDEAKQGKHYGSIAPSVTFRPLNAAAVALMEYHRKLEAAAAVKK